MSFITGIGGSEGFGAGKALVRVNTFLKPVKTSIRDAEAEIAKFRAAQDIYVKELELLAAETETSAGKEAADIFRAYRLLAQDEEFFKTAFERVRAEKINIEYAVDDERGKIAAFFDSMDDDYMKERAADIENVCGELIRIMMGINQDFLPGVLSGCIILVADNLTPAETVKLDKSHLSGIVTERGGVTSHTVILAKSLGIPAIVGARGAIGAIRDGDFVQIDAFHGKIQINPDEKSRKAFAVSKARLTRRRKSYALAEARPAVTKDGFEVNVSINSGGPDGTAAFDASRCDGVGLFRTEYIYMNASGYPSEEDQFEIYKRAAERAGGKEVIIRTLDLGGNKRASYMKLSDEENPFLGYRAIRLCLDRKDIFAVQLRAILRASAFGNVKIMFPMIVSVEELISAKTCIEIEKQKLRDENIVFRDDIPVGVMIETPAAVLISDRLAGHCSFFSVGSNDLAQYITAADHDNERVQRLCDCSNVSVLRGVHIVAKNAAKAQIPWGLCGEAASNERLIPIWVAMGASFLSVASSHVGAVKHLINNINRTSMEKELEAVLTLDRAEDVKSHMDLVLTELKL